MFTRRHMLQKLLTGLKSLALFHFMPSSAVMAAGRAEGAQQPHYKLLNGVSLRQLAASKAHHGPDGRFFNPLGHVRRRLKFTEVLHWKLFSENEYKPYLDDQPITQVQVDWQKIKSVRGLSVTFIKHASVLIKDLDKYLIIDPVFNPIFWFIKDYSPVGFDLKELPEIDHILITHGHYDHIHKASLSAFDPKTHVISPLGYDRIFSDLNMHHRRQLDWFDTYTDGQREITLLPCNHWTMRNPITGPNRALWGSYLIKTATGKTIYVSGDTAFFDGFDEIGKRYDIDLAIINLGAYAPRWFMAPSHMNPRETVDAFKQLRARKLMVVHWGTFRLGDEPVHFPPMDLREIMEQEGLLDRWIDLRHGQTVELA
jgi:N-acyl-phosphatidylethanolamine-hydrolysing phospholipase D